MQIKKETKKYQKKKYNIPGEFHTGLTPVINFGKQHYVFSRVQRPPPPKKNVVLEQFSYYEHFRRVNGET